MVRTIPINYCAHAQAFSKSYPLQGNTAITEQWESIYWLLQNCSTQHSFIVSVFYLSSFVTVLFVVVFTVCFTLSCSKSAVPTGPLKCCSNPILTTSQSCFMFTLLTRMCLKVCVCVFGIGKVNITSTSVLPAKWHGVTGVTDFSNTQLNGNQRNI